MLLATLKEWISLKLSLKDIANSKLGFMCLKHGLMLTLEGKQGLDSLSLFRSVFSLIENI